MWNLSTLDVVWPIFNLQEEGQDLQKNSQKLAWQLLLHIHPQKLLCHK